MSSTSVDDEGSQFKNNYFAEMGSGSEGGSYLRLPDFLSLNSGLESDIEEMKFRDLQILGVT